MTEPGRDLVWHHHPPSHTIHRGTFGSVKDQITAIKTFIDGWNNRCQPFVWTKTADQILGKPSVIKFQARDTR